jgi:hypothetical protein
MLKIDFCTTYTPVVNFQPSIAAIITSDIS